MNRLSYLDVWSDKAWMTLTGGIALVSAPWTFWGVWATAFYCTPGREVGADIFHLSELRWL